MTQVHNSSAAVVGGGPAGLMAAEVLSQGGIHVELYDGMPSVGRKFLVAGKGGVNLTRVEPNEQFLSHYGIRQEQIEPLLEKFGPEDLCRWIHELGIDTFVGTSKKVFPVGMKSVSILRAWLFRLKSNGVTFHLQHKWSGWNGESTLLFKTPNGEVHVNPDVVVLALGGGSWPSLGSTGEWVPLLAEHGISVATLKPSNCGFNVAWSDHFRTHYEGVPVKSVIVSFTDSKGNTYHKQGEFIVTKNGVEGNLIYELSAMLRDEIEAIGKAVIRLDLAPGWSQQRLRDRLALPRGSRTLSGHIDKTIHIKGVKANLLWELIEKKNLTNPEYLAAAIKDLQIQLNSTRPLDEAISSAGGVLFEELNEHLMIRTMPGVFCAGEMLDWEAPTGGYLLTACFASGRTAGLGALTWINQGKDN
jgi:uncharacterized flavoprotein (TIGR03862 family)